MTSGGRVLFGSAKAVTGGDGGGGLKVERIGAWDSLLLVESLTAGRYISTHLMVGWGGSGMDGKLQCR